MSRSDKRIADVLRLPFSPEKGGISLCEMTEGADVSDIANILNQYKHLIYTVGADPCVRPRASDVIPLSGEMSRSDKRVADVLRSPLQLLSI